MGFGHLYVFSNTRQPRSYDIYLICPLFLFFIFLFTFLRQISTTVYHRTKLVRACRGRGRNDDNRRDSYNDGDDRGERGDNGDRRDRGMDGDNMMKDQAPRRGRPRYRNRRSQGDPQQRDQREPQRERNGADAVTA